MSDSGKYVRRIADGLTAKAIAAMTYNADDYEEVDELPVTIDESAYKERVERLIRERYSVADELAAHGGLCSTTRLPSSARCRPRRKSQPRHKQPTRRAETKILTAKSRNYEQD